jgi:hypothetical protein
MQLNNEIANLKKKSELIDDERNKLKNQEQENSTQQFEKITQLSRILMAIDHLEGFCKYKKLKFDRAEAVVGLNYDAVNMQNDKDKKENFEEIINKGQFNSYSDRTEVALSQITMIGQYLRDLKVIKESVMQEQKLKDKGGADKPKLAEIEEAPLAVQEE